MRKADLTAAVEAVKTETRAALTALLAEINHGQKKQIVKREEVRAMLDRYGVDYGDET